MCYHSRLIFGQCSHYAWLGISRPCLLEQAFDRGEINTGCSARWSHGFDTLRVQMRCPRCAAAHAKHDSQLGTVKDQIKMLKKRLKMIKGVEVAKEEEEWLNLHTVNEEGSQAVGSGGDPAGDTTVDENEGVLNVIVEEVSVDPKYYLLELPQIVAECMAREAEAKETETA